MILIRNFELYQSKINETLERARKLSEKYETSRLCYILV